MCERESGEKLATASAKVIEKFDLGDGKMEVTFSFDGQVYRGEFTNRTNEDFCVWMQQYANRTPRCSSCKGLILPETTIIVNPAGFNNDAITHVSCGEGHGLVGHFDEDAKCHLVA